MIPNRFSRRVICWGHFLFFYYYVYIRCYLFTQIFGWWRMNVLQALGGRFNCMVGPEIYYTQVLVGFQCHVCISISSFYSGADELQFVSTHLTHSRSFWSQQGALRTQILVVSLFSDYCQLSFTVGGSLCTGAVAQIAVTYLHRNGFSLTPSFFSWIGKLTRGL